MDLANPICLTKLDEGAGEQAMLVLVLYVFGCLREFVTTHEVISVTNHELISVYVILSLLTRLSVSVLTRFFSVYMSLSLLTR
jgi:hypothetical protein